MPTLPCISVSRHIEQHRPHLPFWSCLQLEAWRDTSILLRARFVCVGSGKGTKGNPNGCLWQKWLQQWQESDRISSAWQSMGSRRDVCKWPEAVSENKLIYKKWNIYGTGSFPSKWTFLLKRKRHSQNSGILWKQENCGMTVWRMLRTAEGSFDLRTSIYLSEVFCLKFFL